MREYPLDLTPHLKVGLSKELADNDEGLFSCTNCRPTGKGMEYKNPYDSFMDIGVNFPFGQLVITEDHKLLVYSNGIYVLLSNAWTLKLSSSQTQHICIADFKASVMLAGSGKTSFLHSNGDITTVTNAPNASTCCNYRGLPILGNINSWTESADADSSTVVWGRLNSSNFALHESNSPTGVGYIKLLIGTVLKVVDQDKQLVVFGTQGISILELGNNILPTFGVVRTIPCAISRKEHIVVGRDAVFFIDVTGYLCAYKDGQMERLGYRHLFRGLDLVTSHNSLDNEVYISSSEQCYVYTSHGMGQLDQCITSGAFDGSEFYCVCSVPVTENMEVVHDRVDMGTGSLKTAYAQELLIETDETVHVGEDFTNGSRTYSSGPYVSISPNGVGTSVISGNAFRFKVKITNPTEVRLYGHIVRWKLTDARSIRGMYYDNKVAS